MKNQSIFIFCVVFLQLSCSVLANENQDFQNILSNHWSEAKKEKVFFRTDPDAFRMNATLPEFSKEARLRRQKFNQSIIEQLQLIDTTQLDKANQVSFKLFNYERQAEANSYTQPAYLFPITKLFGYHTYFADAPANMTFLEAEDYQKYLISLADFPRYNSEQIDLLKEAIKKGFVHYCESMNGYEQSISQHIVKNAEESALFVPFKTFPSQLTLQQKQLFTEQGKDLIMQKIVPEFQTFFDFYTQEYIKNCRQKPGINSVKGGADYYQSEIEFYTTTQMQPKEIHQLGLSEVKRIRGEMQAIMEQVGFNGDFKAFLNYLRDDEKFYAKTEIELLGRAALIAKNMEGELPKFFSLLPRGTYKIKSGSRGAFYMGASGDGKTSGSYFLGTADLKSQPLYALEALTFHESVPGHHLQSAIALELDIPEFRKTLYHSAFGEGWGLYSERLGKEMGFYQDPYSDFGRLTYEAFRAVRLVVDTGIHAFGWSRQKAIDYMLENTGLSNASVTNQIDRYITWPAQALSYKIGELKIRALRAKAEKKLGIKFDVRLFHDTLIGNGSLPIAVLEELIDDWIKQQKSI